LEATIVVSGVRTSQKLTTLGTLKKSLVAEHRQVILNVLGGLNNLLFAVPGTIHNHFIFVQDMAFEMLPHSIDFDSRNIAIRFGELAFEKE